MQNKASATSCDSRKVFATRKTTAGLAASTPQNSFKRNKQQNQTVRDQNGLCVEFGFKRAMRSANTFTLLQVSVGIRHG